MTKYDPKFCQELVECGKKGLTVAQAAMEMGVSRRVLFNWRDTHPEFSEAWEDYVDASQAHWEKIAHSAVFNSKDYNGNLITWQLMKRFPKDYQENKQKVEISGDPDGAPVKMEVSNAVSSAILALKAWKETQEDKED